MEENLITIDFESGVQLTVLDGTKITLNQITIYQITDNLLNKKITANCGTHPGVIVLWEGQAYDNKGDWTKNDVIDRVREIFA